MKKLFLFLFFVLSYTLNPAWAFDFSAIAPSGQTLYFNITGNNVIVVCPEYGWGGYEKPTGLLIIPSMVTYNNHEYYVSQIGDDAFSYCDGLTSVTIPNSVTEIGESAFNDCEGLGSVILPTTISIIRDEAFWGCSNLTCIDVPPFVTTIGHLAFGFVRNIVYNGSAKGSPWGALCVNGYVEDNLVYTDASKRILVGCASSATSVNIPSSVEQIGEEAFFSCFNLTSITIPNTVTKIGQNAFCPIKNIIYYGKAKGAPWGALCLNGYIDGDFIYSDPSKMRLVGCTSAPTSVTNIVIPNVVTTIGKGAFSSCSNLTSVEIPNTVTSIEEGAFWGCTGLTSVSIPNSVTTIGFQAFFGCTGLTSLFVPNSVTSIGLQAFLGVQGIEYNGSAVIKEEFDVEE